MSEAPQAEKPALSLILASVGLKGGSGKTTIAHMLSHALQRQVHDSLVVLAITDVLREREAQLADMTKHSEGRRFVVRDARAEGMPLALVKHIRDKGGVLVFDGGGSMAGALPFFAQNCNTVVVPMKISDSDVIYAADTVRSLKAAGTAKVIVVPIGWGEGDASALKVLRSEFAGLEHHILRHVVPDSLKSFAKLTRNEIHATTQSLEKLPEEERAEAAKVSGFVIGQASTLLRKIAQHKPEALTSAGVPDLIHIARSQTKNEPIKQQ